jgi:uncharacterized protein YqhQ
LWDALLHDYEGNCVRKLGIVQEGIVLYLHMGKVFNLKPKFVGFVTWRQVFQKKFVEFALKWKIFSWLIWIICFWQIAWT